MCIYRYQIKTVFLITPVKSGLNTVRLAIITGTCSEETLDGHRHYSAAQSEVLYFFLMKERRTNDQSRTNKAKQIW